MCEQKECVKFEIAKVGLICNNRGRGSNVNLNENDQLVIIFSKESFDIVKEVFIDGFCGSNLFVVGMGTLAGSLNQLA